MGVAARRQKRVIVAAKRIQTGKGYFMISAVADLYEIHPQTLRWLEKLETRHGWIHQ